MLLCQIMLMGHVVEQPPASIGHMQPSTHGLVNGQDSNEHTMHETIPMAMSNAGDFGGGSVFQAMIRPSPALHAFMPDNAYGAMQAGSSNPMYGNIGVRPEFMDYQGQLFQTGDPKFIGHFWTSLFKSLGTNLLFSSAYHPQTDGQTERVNQILEEMLRHYIQQRLASWKEYLPLVEFAYNNAPDSVITGMTLFQAAYGHTPLVPTNFVLQHKVALADQLVQEMQDILVQVRDILVHVQQKYQKQANKHRRHAKFNEGDLVLLYVASHRYKTMKSVFPKLRPRFYGPFKIIKKNSVVSYKLELPPSWGKLHPTFHISWLKQYIQGDSPVPALSSYVPEIEDEHVILVPEKILDVRQKETRRKLTTEFLVKWMDLDESDSTWQTDEEMQQYPNLLQEFFDKRQIFL
ncbi:hypothetical protein L7F22_059610 [Adiantum nelumboides]|nr:hypothetical protein [Adiantum nelumboides]